VNTPAAYQKLIDRVREIALISSAGRLLSWDQETFMPPQGLRFRADQLAFMSGWTHRLFTASEVGDWIKECEDHGFSASGDEGANVREWRRSYDRKVKLPQSLVEEFERAQSFAREAWMEARRDANFPKFQPHLEKLLTINREMAAYWGFQNSPYDALLEDYEPGARTRQIQALCAELRPQIASLVRAARERSNDVPADFLKGQYPVEKQRELNREIAQAIGFDFSAGRIDTTVHPFCSEIGPGDCRLTTRYNVEDFTESLYSVLHETGHGLYEQGLNQEAYGTPMGNAASLGIHESQSRLWENHVGRSPSFWEHWLPRACHYFPELRRFTAEQITAAVNRVSPSFIRVEADEVTYDLHVILRFEIEMQLMEDRIKVSDVPHFWNEEFENLLGLKVPNDAQGCLQDIHWSLGSFGYFPTYTLGNLNASQLFHRALAEEPSLEKSLARGAYQPLLSWLRDHVHRHGQRFAPQALMRTATGEPTTAKYHLDYLRKKFLP